MQQLTVNPKPQKRGVTLVELLVVIVIIGILIGILLPVIGAVRKRGQITSINLEIQNLTTAIETYKQTYGDYPPDGSSYRVFVSHVQSIFPRIDPLELRVLQRLIAVPGSTATYLDPSESLVFFLGGFSDDPRYPFTGDGGPFSRNRTGGFYDFSPERLTTDGDNICRVRMPEGAFFIPAASLDERAIHGGLGPDYVPTDSQLQIPTNPSAIPTSPDGPDSNWQAYPDTKIDIFPSYLPPNCDVPYVYFDSRTYITRNQYGYPQSGHYLTSFPMHPSTVRGLARPYRSDNKIPPRVEDPYPAKFISDDGFQIISAGVNNDYGIWSGSAVWKHFPLGDGFESGDLSNITSFSQGVLEDELP